MSKEEHNLTFSCELTIQRTFHGSSCRTTRYRIPPDDNVGEMGETIFEALFEFFRDDPEKAAGILTFMHGLLATRDEDQSADDNGDA